MDSPDGLADAKAIHRQTGNTFYYGTRLLPERVREPTYVLYGFFRIADEIVDGSSEQSPAVQRDRLTDLRDQALGRAEPTNPVLAAFDNVRQQHGIPDREIEAFVQAMLADIETTRYESYPDLRGYMRGSAAAVGAMMAHVIQPDDLEATLPFAKTLGEAFQLTNFIRDVREDILQRSRIYLPLETLDAHGIDETKIEQLAFDENVAKAVRHELRRAESLYRESVAGIRHLHSDCQFPVLLAAILYSDYHRLVRANGFDVLSSAPSLSTARKMWLTIRTRWAWLWTDDPEAVFERVSAVPSTAPEIQSDREGAPLTD